MTDDEANVKVEWKAYNSNRVVFLSPPLLQKNFPDELSKYTQLNQGYERTCEELKEERAKVHELEATVTVLEDQLKSKTEDVDCLVAKK